MNTEKEIRQNHLLNSSDAELLQMLNNNQYLYNNEVIEDAQQVAKSRGLISHYPDKEFNVITKDGRESGLVGVEAIKEIYLKNLISDESIVHINSLSRWLPLKEVFDTDAWKPIIKREEIEDPVQVFSSTVEDISITPSQLSESDFQAPTADVININANNDEEEKTIYLRKNNQESGPYNELEIIRLINEEQFTFNNLACVEGMNEWKPLGTILKDQNLPDELQKSIKLDRWARESLLPVSHDHGQYYGVNGWLLLFCVQLTILGPLLTFGSIGQTMDAIRRVGNGIPAFAPVAYTEIIIMSAMGIFSFCTGILLWSKKSNAVGMAQIYLVFVVIAAFINLALPLPEGFPESARRAASSEATSAMFRAIIYAVIWSLYLSKSKRVRDTYIGGA